MSFQVPSTEPTSIAAGEEWHWTKSFPGFTPAEGWGITYTFLERKGTTKKTIVGTPQAASQDYDFKITAANNEEVPAGMYDWVAIATNGAEKHRAAFGSTDVKPNLVKAPSGAGSNEKLLEAVEARLYERVTEGALIDQYGIHGRTVAKMPLKDLLALRGQLKAIINAERHPDRIGTDVEFTFGNP